MKISVIIPAYNVQEYIRRSIESVLCQEIKPFEVIVIDDGSTDNTAKIIKEYPNIIYYYKENGGEPTARNLGIQKAKGDWIAWLDSDDEWLPNHLENFKKVLIKSPFLKWYGAPINSFNSSNGKIIEKYHKSKKNKLIDNSYFKDYMSAIPPYAFFSSDTFVIKKSVFDKVGYFDELKKVGCDLDMWFRIALQFPEIGFSHEVGANVFRRENSISHTTHKPFINALNRFRDSENMAKELGPKYVDRVEPRIIYWVTKLIRSSISNNDIMALEEIRKIYYDRLSFKYQTILFLGIQVPFIFQIYKLIRNK